MTDTTAVVLRLRLADDGSGIAGWVEVVASGQRFAVHDDRELVAALTDLVHHRPERASSDDPAVS